LISLLAATLRSSAVICLAVPLGQTVADSTYKLAFKKSPFRIQEEGWGEFDMTIDLVADKTHTIKHDLNFSQERYEAKHQIVSSQYTHDVAIFTNLCVL
jgi:hypothetical protein